MKKIKSFIVRSVSQRPNLGRLCVSLGGIELGLVQWRRQDYFVARRGTKLRENNNNGETKNIMKFMQ